MQSWTGSVTITN